MSADTLQRLDLAIPVVAYLVQQEYDNGPSDEYPSPWNHVMTGMGVGWVVAVGATVVGGYLVWDGYREERRRSVAIQPVVSPNQLGFALGGRF